MNHGTRLFGPALALLRGLLVAAPALAAEEVPDASITTWVDAALRLDPLVEASELSVSTENGKVTLRGDVATWSVFRSRWGSRAASSR